VSPIGPPLEKFKVFMVKNIHKTICKLEITKYHFRSNLGGFNGQVHFPARIILEATRDYQGSVSVKLDISKDHFRSKGHFMVKNTHKTMCNHGIL
jgi:hypothetical protein